MSAAKRQQFKAWGSKQPVRDFGHRQAGDMAAGVSGPRPSAAGADHVLRVTLCPLESVSNARAAHHPLPYLSGPSLLGNPPAIYRTGPPRERAPPRFMRPAPLTTGDIDNQTTDAKQAERNITRNRASRRQAKPTRAPRMAQITLPSEATLRQYDAGITAGDARTTISKNRWQKSDQRHRGRCAFDLGPADQTQMPDIRDPHHGLTKHKRTSWSPRPLAHIMARADQDLCADTKVTIGPVIKDGWVL